MEHDIAFKNIKKQLAHSTALSFPKHGCQTWLFTNASDEYGAAVLTQVPENEMSQELEKQHREPLAFLSGAFSGSSAKWSVPEKEGFAVAEPMTKLDYLVSGQEVVIFTDHANLVYLYDPFGLNPGIARHSV